MNVRVTTVVMPKRSTLYSGVAEVIVHEGRVKLLYHDDAQEIPLSDIWILTIDNDGADP